jgi:hypothetical protein
MLSKRSSRGSVAASSHTAELKSASQTGISVGTGADEDDGAQPAEKKVLRNQFNFSERASQTFNQTVKVCLCLCSNKVSGAIFSAGELRSTLFWFICCY